MKEAHFLACVPVFAAAVVCWFTLSSLDDYRALLEPCKRVQFDDTRLIATDGDAAESPSWWSIGFFSFVSRKPGKSIDIGAVGEASRDDRYDPLTLRVDVRSACPLSRQQTRAKERLERRPGVPDGYEAVIMCVLDERDGPLGHCFHLYMQPASGRVIFNGTLYTADDAAPGGCGSEENVAALAHLLAVCRSCYLEVPLTPIQMASWLNDTDTGVNRFLAAATYRRRELPSPEHPHRRPWLRRPSTHYVSFPPSDALTAEGHFTGMLEGSEKPQQHNKTMDGPVESLKEEGGVEGWLMRFLNPLWLWCLVAAMGGGFVWASVRLHRRYSVMCRIVLGCPDDVRKSLVKVGYLPVGLAMWRYVQHLLLGVFLFSTLIAEGYWSTTDGLLTWGGLLLIALAAEYVFVRHGVDEKVWWMWMRYEICGREALWQGKEAPVGVLCFTAFASLVGIFSSGTGIAMARRAVGFCLPVQLMLLSVLDPDVHKDSILRLGLQYLCHYLSGIAGDSCYLVRLLVTALSALTVATSAHGLLMTWTTFSEEFGAMKREELRRLPVLPGMPKWFWRVLLNVCCPVWLAVCRIPDLVLGFSLLGLGLLSPALLLATSCHIGLTIAAGWTSLDVLDLAFPCALLFVTRLRETWLHRGAVWLAGLYLVKCSTRAWSHRHTIRKLALLISGSLRGVESASTEEDGTAPATATMTKSQKRKQKRARKAAAAGQGAAGILALTDVSPSRGSNLLALPSSAPSAPALLDAPAHSLTAEEEPSETTKPKTRRRKKKRPVAKGGRGHNTPPSTEQKQQQPEETPVSMGSGAASWRGRGRWPLEALMGAQEIYEEEQHRWEEGEGHEGAEDGDAQDEEGEEEHGEDGDPPAPFHPDSIIVLPSGQPSGQPSVLPSQADGLDEDEDDEGTEEAPSQQQTDATEPPSYEAKCLMCLSATPTELCVPCGHTFLCEDCRQVYESHYLAKGCPYCQTAVQMLVHVQTP
ncbi:unnamed protein product [Vitrella brassicaformis CCMP3155]|uniref:RING-type domain-containing protein n=3 Tax=Vitrella brassicaformis TaxID=1169539 RepID=A0A0G4GLW9_VITBC|nr:unnamed protein product [Vitrella brassicaformis CCMP3155]|mmetsp:Transcript_44459/g.125752  ORF Transcript_44459/g.125752 Transcript_44459/m.125752 type:complete len:980 (-) Transcript_44459:1059-3998(-)|eukprot:CEM31123.1 unnamed protein product [Vitrella brassicaformis CCMP3155]